MKEPKIYVGGVPVVLILGTAMLVAGLYYIYMEAVSFAPEYRSELVMASYAVVLSQASGSYTGATWRAAGASTSAVWRWV